MPKIVSSIQTHQLILENVPMDTGSFWSVRVYGGRGFATGKHYNVNSAFAVKNSDGKYVINLDGSE